MNIDNQYKRTVFNFLFSWDESAAVKINSVHGEHTNSVRTTQKWFKKFKVGESSIYDELRSGRPVNFDNDFLYNLVESEPQLTMDEIAERMDSSHVTVFLHLKEIGKYPSLKSGYRMSYLKPISSSE